MNTKRRCRTISLGGESPPSSFVGSGNSLFSIHERISKMHRSYSGLAWLYLKWIDYAVHSAQFRTFEGCWPFGLGSCLPWVLVPCLGTWMFSCSSSGGIALDLLWSRGIWNLMRWYSVTWRESYLHGWLITLVFRLSPRPLPWCWQNCRVGMEEGSGKFGG